MICYFFPFYSFSVVFWFGDLNYRIDLPNEIVRNLIDTNQYHDLIEHDQVRESKILRVEGVSICEGRW